MIIWCNAGISLHKYTHKYNISAIIVYLFLFCLFINTYRPCSVHGSYKRLGSHKEITSTEWVFCLDPSIYMLVGFTNNYTIKCWYKFYLPFWTRQGIENWHRAPCSVNKWMYEVYFHFKSTKNPIFRTLRSHTGPWSGCRRLHILIKNSRIIAVLFILHLQA